MNLKIVAISDLHGNLPIIEEPADIMLLAGDIIPLNIQFNKPKSSKWFLGPFADWVYELPVDKVFAVPGNHDAFLETVGYGALRDIRLACNGKVEFLINETTYWIDTYGQKWSIFGTPYCHMFGNWPFMLEDDELTKKFEQIPDNIDIIISHDPPFGFGDVDIVMEDPARMWEHIGNTPLTKRLFDVQYQLLVCGHIHSGDHLFNEIHKCANVSLLDENYKVRYKPFYKELEKWN